MLRSNRLSYSPGVRLGGRLRLHHGPVQPRHGRGPGQPFVSVDRDQRRERVGPGPSMARCVPSAPNHCGFCAASVAQSATTTLGYRPAPLARTALFGSCHGRSTCTLTKTTRDAPPRIAIMLSKSVSVIGPLVPSADDDVRAELAAPPSGLQDRSHPRTTAG